MRDNCWLGIWFGGNCTDYNFWVGNFELIDILPVFGIWLGGILILEIVEWTAYDN